MVRANPTRGAILPPVEPSEELKRALAGRQLERASVASIEVDHMDDETGPLLWAKCVTQASIMHAKRRAFAVTVRGEA